MTEESPSGSAKPKRSTARRRLRALAIALVSATTIAIVAGVCARLYYNDERLRRILESTLSDHTQTEVAVGALELSLLSGLEIRDVTMGPPEGFERSPLSIGVIEARYVASALVSGRVEIPVVRVESVSLVLEENDQGTNIDAILKAMLPPAPAPASPTVPQDEPVDPDAGPLPTLPALPLDVVVRSVELGPVDVTVERPDARLRLDTIYAEAEANIIDSQYGAVLWLGLGARNDPESKSQLELNQEGTAALSGRQRLSAELNFANFDNIAFTVRFDGETDPDAPIDTPPIQSTLDLDLVANLLNQTATLRRAELTVGKGTRFSVTANASDLLGERSVDIGPAKLTTDLDELEAIARAVNPSLRLGGSAELTTSPMRVTDFPPNPALVSITTEALRARFGPHAARGIDSEFKVALDGDQARLDAQVDLAEASSGENRVRGLTLRLQGSSAVASWLGPEAGDFSGEATVALNSAETAQATLNGANTTVAVSGPVALIRDGASETPLEFSVTQLLAQAKLPGQRIRRVRVDTNGSLNDLAGNQARLRAKAEVEQIDSQVEGETVRVPPIAAGLTVARSGQLLTAKDVRLSVGTLFDLRGELVSERTFTQVPRIRRTRLLLKPFDLEKAVALLPAALRPNQRFGGTVSFDAELTGEVPIKTLSAAARPPANLDEVGPFLERLATLFESGLPLNGYVSIETNKVFYEDLSTFARDLSVDFDLNLLESGPKLELALLLETLEQPASLGGLELNTSLAFNRRVIESDTFLKLGRLEGPGLPKPLRDATLEWKATYQVGGAFAVENLAARAPDRDGRLIASFLVQTPLRIIQERSWEQPGMPGIDLIAGLEAGLRIDESAPLTVPGVDVEGAVGFDTRLVIRDGIIDSSGLLTARRLSLENETVVVSDIDGGFPFEVSLATLPQEGYVELPQRVLFGDGRVRVGIGKEVKLASRRPLYFPRIRRYRADRGVRIRSIYARGFEVEYLELDGALRNGQLVAERARLSLLGGDIDGSMSVGLSAERSVSGSMDVKVSNLDASYFPALDLKPGKDSEVDADATLGFVVSPKRRDLTANMNVTKISAKGFDRLLQLLDPDEENSSIQSTRFYLNLAQINGVAMWLAYENLNMDLDANSIVKIPFTDVGVPNFERELLRRMSMSDYLDLYWDPIAQRTFSPLVGAIGAR